MWFTNFFFAINNNFFLFKFVFTGFVIKSFKLQKMIWAEKENTGEHLHPQFVPHLISGPAQQRLSNPKVRISSHLPKLLKEIHLLPLLPKVRTHHIFSYLFTIMGLIICSYIIDLLIMKIIEKKPLKILYIVFQMGSERF